MDGGQALHLDSEPNVAPAAGRGESRASLAGGRFVFEWRLSERIGVASGVTVEEACCGCGCGGCLCNASPATGLQTGTLG
jgi:hypothetical protein